MIFVNRIIKTRLLSRQKYACRDNITFVNFDATKYIYRDKHVFCRDTHTFVETKDVFCRYKYVFVATKFFFRDKNDTCGSSRQ